MLEVLISGILCFIKQNKKKGRNLYVSKNNVVDGVRSTLLGLLYFLGNKRSTTGKNGFGLLYIGKKITDVGICSGRHSYIIFWMDLYGSPRINL
jgi:hypothetical protein